MNACFFVIEPSRVSVFVYHLLRISLCMDKEAHRTFSPGLSYSFLLLPFLLCPAIAQPSRRKESREKKYNTWVPYCGSHIRSVSSDRFKQLIFESPEIYVLKSSNWMENCIILIKKNIFGSNQHTELFRKQRILAHNEP